MNPMHLPDVSGVRDYDNKLAGGDHLWCSGRAIGCLAWVALYEYVKSSGLQPFIIFDFRIEDDKFE